MMTSKFSVIFLASLVFVGCGKREHVGQTVINFWAIGSEGEQVQRLVREFEQANPGVQVKLQQIPWNAAHEKLLTAFAGDATPDLCQLGNTWIPEFAALNALEPLDTFIAHSNVVRSADFFPGIWETNRVEKQTFGVPWYADTRILFYRRDILEAAGFHTAPETWDAWLAAMRMIKQNAGPNRYALLIPTNEWEQPTIFALQTGAQMLRDNDQYANFRTTEFRTAFEFYTRLFEEGLAPAKRNTEISNVWEEFARGYFAMYITGPWNIGEFRRRLPPELQDKWSTAPLPRPASSAHSMSQAGGSGLVIFRRSRHQDEAWRFIEFLSQPAQQVEFYKLTGNLPPRESSWDLGKLADDPPVAAFHQQLQHVAPLPRVPEWEQITTRIMQAGQEVIAGQSTIDEAVKNLDDQVDALLNKRRWMLARHDVDP
jgi:multiple sugar transport system substrate-binding protein